MIKGERGKEVLTCWYPCEKVTLSTLVREDGGKIQIYNYPFRKGKPDPKHPTSQQ